MNTRAGHSLSLAHDWPATAVVNHDKALQTAINHSKNVAQKITRTNQLAPPVPTCLFATFRSSFHGESLMQNWLCVMDVPCEVARLRLCACAGPSRLLLSIEPTLVSVVWVARAGAGGDLQGCSTANCRLQRRLQRIHLCGWMMVDADPKPWRHCQSEFALCFSGWWF